MHPFVLLARRKWQVSWHFLEEVTFLSSTIVSDHTYRGLCASSQAETSKHPGHLEECGALTRELHQKGTAETD